MIVDGESYACETCIRGHRVSSCQHHDRPLQHITKKGRPVVQCQHCRSMRQSHSAHVKCHCGKKARGEAIPDGADRHAENCRCSEGRTCICASKKPSADNGSVQASTPDQSNRDFASDIASNDDGFSFNSMSPLNNTEPWKPILTAQGSPQEQQNRPFDAAMQTTDIGGGSFASQAHEIPGYDLDMSALQYPPLDNLDMFTSMPATDDSLFSGIMDMSNIDWGSDDFSTAATLGNADNFNALDFFVQDEVDLDGSTEKTPGEDSVNRTSLGHPIQAAGTQHIDTLGQENSTSSPQTK